ncbi:sigma-70 family RNA polymerase sigma factor [Streptomyces sp. N2-109]|uniref:Sigma-70 family RNA polymerase sigma factor n=1 Tax=Streptomyces gossypii TaxID=2883101 RepID=A0ABT2JPK0_9ACTN|nr:sigma-70 family RNA polymerase sigma factor [Streptomyces gossypii]MCT2589300.1 sigma-70 family RNA polymerase sigma factor [Streptomyces gossypii]
MNTTGMDTLRHQSGSRKPPEDADRWTAAARLVEAAQSGDALALNDLLNLLTPYVTRLCRPIALTHGPDAVQESLIAVFQGLPRLKDPTALYGWVRVITVREAVRVARRAQRETPVSEFDDVAGWQGTELAADVHDVLRRMSSEHRAVLVLRELEGLDERSASEVLNISCGTVKSRLHRARNSFRKAWTR